ncbi:chaperone modulator CbpM [Actinopolymorpha sp. B11F2]|uniref:chaperone modulator CbpM n=1 Tax=Actinopolymorpha sp. B11F2 TaxID=3160862 RepID=UPI0032E4EA8C
MTFAVVRVQSRRGSDLMDLETFARRAGVHPELVRRLVRLGLLEPTRDTRGQLVFAPNQLVALARIERLRAGACLNYAAIGLVVDLLDRIAELEATLRRSHQEMPARPSETRPTGGRPWTRTG